MNKKQRFMQPVNILAPNGQSVPGVAQSVMEKALTIQDSLQILDGRASNSRNATTKIEAL